MNSRERVALALNHQEADYVPLDIGGTGVSQIHATAYYNLRRYLNLPAREPKIIFVAEQLAKFETDIAERLETDVQEVARSLRQDMQELVTGMTASIDRLHSRISDLQAMESRGDESVG